MAYPKILQAWEQKEEAYPCLWGDHVLCFYMEWC